MSDTLERIVPLELEQSGATGQDTYRFHIQRYEFAAKFAVGPSLLDIACGVGYGTKFLAETCPGVTQAHGVDLSQNAVAYAREHYRDHRVSYFCEDAIKFRGSGAYDAITSLETIEHVPDPRAFLRHGWFCAKHAIDGRQPAPPHRLLGTIHTDARAFMWFRGNCGDASGAAISSISRYKGLRAQARKNARGSTEVLSGPSE